MTRTPPPDPDWLIRLATTSITEAVERLSSHGVVVVLAEDGIAIPNLPPATEAEIGAAAGSRNGVGFLLRRRIARALAAEACGQDAAVIRLVADANGKPGFEMPGVGLPGVEMPGVAPAAPRLHVSFSARSPLNLIAVAHDPVGVDLEMPITQEAIPWNILRPDEADAIRALPAPEQPGAFVRLWSLKEAFLKASGNVLAIPPEAIRIADDDTIAVHSDARGSRAVEARLRLLRGRSTVSIGFPHPTIALALLSAAHQSAMRGKD
ncbi:MAG: 4'-phosphopantetheinyl [Beijerinckiaceae bacterium]|nr:MAG: 4'-phosphopantetheinyl [Beijerinckiaceae bacterium]